MSDLPKSTASPSRQDTEDIPPKKKRLVAMKPPPDRSDPIKAISNDIPTFFPDGTFNPDSFHTHLQDPATIFGKRDLDSDSVSSRAWSAEEEETPHTHSYSRPNNASPAPSVVSSRSGDTSPTTSLAAKDSHFERHQEAAKKERRKEAVKNRLNRFDPSYNR